MALVLGAGCSSEEPTGLPFAGDLSEECFRKLCADGVLTNEDVGNPRDLSEVADAVVRVRGEQQALVDRFPPDTFRNAAPNDGYLVMAALMQEGVVTTTMTLNFDLAATTALASLNAGASVSTIRGPEDHGSMGGRNLIYLHRDINAHPNNLILRTEALENAWSDRWEEIVAQRVVAGAVTVFVGLGSPSRVLLATTKRILAGLQTGARAYVIDPAVREDSAFFAELQLDDEAYVQLGWNALMGRLADRVVEEHRAELERECAGLAQDLELADEDVASTCERLSALGLVGLGKLRASWLMVTGPYQPRTTEQLRLLSDLILAVAMIERVAGTEATFSDEGVIEFVGVARTVRILLCSGGGWMTRAYAESKARGRIDKLTRGRPGPLVTIIGGVSDGDPPAATPDNIAGGRKEADIIAGTETCKLLTLGRIRTHPDEISEVFG